MMLSGFPSSLNADKDAARVTLAAYLEAVKNQDDDIVAGACSRLLRRNYKFPPSAGELHAECEKFAHDRARAAAAGMPRLPRRKRGLSALPPEERAAARERVQDMVDGFKRSAAEARLK